MSEYRFYLTRVFTIQWQVAFAFYRDVLEFPVEFADEAMGWAQFKLGGAAIGLESCAPAAPEAKELVGRFTGISLEVDDIAATYAKLRQEGVVFTAPPTVQPWGGVLAHFKDLDGNTLTLLGNPSQPS